MHVRYRTTSPTVDGACRIRPTGEQTEIVVINVKIENGLRYRSGKIIDIALFYPSSGSMQTFQANSS
jgi:hypothetical protein